MPAGGRVVVLISADAEWNVIQKAGIPEQTPFGSFLRMDVGKEAVIFFQGGWGKISAAASTQYAIDRWRPELLVNLGTCGGFAGEIECGDVLLIERTIVYDIIEQMGDFEQAIRHYATDLDLSWVGDDLPPGVQRCLLVSADRDLLPEDIGRLRVHYVAVAADWESGAIAWVVSHNQVPCLILRGVTDLVGSNGSEAYGDYSLFVQRTADVMQRLINDLPAWLDRYFKSMQASQKKGLY